MNKLKRFLGNLIYRLSQYECKLDLTSGSSIHKTALLRKVHLRGQISVGEKSALVGGVYMSGKVSVGRFTTINGPNVGIYSKFNQIAIGSFCSIARNVTIQEFNHRYDSVSTFLLNKNVFHSSEVWEHDSKGTIVIGNDVWVGAGCIILSGVKIGNGAVLAAGSIVTKDVPEYAIVGGNPAKIIRYRFDNEIIDLLRKIDWCSWSEEQLMANRNIFEGQVSRDKLLKLLE